MVINKVAYSNNNNNGIDAMFLLRTEKSLDIEIDSFNEDSLIDFFNEDLKPLLSRHRIMKSLKLQSWLCSKR